MKLQTIIAYREEKHQRAAQKAIFAPVLFFVLLCYNYPLVSEMIKERRPYRYV